MKRLSFLTKIVSTLVILFIIAEVILVFCLSNNEPTYISLDSNPYSIEEFTLNDTMDIKLPYSVKGVRGRSMLVSTKLPNVIGNNYAISFRSLYSANEVFVDGELIGSYATKLPLSFGRMTGNIRVIVPVEPSMAGKNLDIVITPYYDVNMDLSEIMVGEIDEIHASILSDNMVRLIVCLILLTILVIGIAIFAYQVLTRQKMGIKMLRSFVLFDLFVILWLICSSDLPQFFTNGNEAISLISFLSLSIMCIPYMSFCEIVIPKGQKIFLILKSIGWLIPIINIFGFAFDLYDPMEVLLLTHIFIVCSISSSLYIAIKTFKEGVYSKFLVAGIIEVVFSAGVGLICWYMAPSKGYDGVAFGIGFVLFILTMMGMILYMQAGVIEEKKYMDSYKRMAYTDSLTGLRNRSAFEEKFADMYKQELNNAYVSLIMFDLNNLKHTNDNYGHQAGDELIVGMGHCLAKCFGSYGDCFRLGGDEYAVVLIDHKGEVPQLLEEFKYTLLEYNKEHEHKLSSAIGYAELEWKAGETFFRDIYKIADKEMYIDKQRTKHGKV